MKKLMLFLLLSAQIALGQTVQSWKVYVEGARLVMRTTTGDSIYYRFAAKDLFPISANKYTVKIRFQGGEINLTPGKTFKADGITAYSGTVVGLATALDTEIEKISYFASRATAPPTPSSGFRLYANATNALSWKGANGYVRTFDGTANTADRTYTLPDASGTLPLLGSTQTFSGSNTFSTAISNTIRPLTDGAGEVGVAGGAFGLARIVTILTEGIRERVANGGVRYTSNNSVEQARMFSDGNWYFGTSPVNSGFKGDFAGTLRVQGAVTLTNQTVSNAVAVPATHKVAISINGTTYYLLATNIP